MSTVAEIWSAIQKLSLQERAELAALLHPFADDDWNRQMKADAAAGKLDQFHREAEAEYAAGKTVSLTHILREP